MLCIAVRIMTTATKSMRRFNCQRFESVGMNYGRHDQHKHQHDDGNIPYGHTKYAHGNRNSTDAATVL